MDFDQSTRNQLSHFVSDARALLTEEFIRQLQRTYGIDPTTGEVTALERLTGITDAERQTADLLRETGEHYLPGFGRLSAKSRRDTIERMVREQAFTVLNRLCALRMAEARGLLIESIAVGYQSRGFQLYARLAGSALGETGDAYCCYLFSIFDELAVDLPVLFDRFSPQGRLFPGETALRALLDLINQPEIEALWAEDETIGWIYQYFNSKEERKAMRDASAAPRNSRELAVRNQFFTPRYVVEFLTDNTLGRIWYEMTRGQTSLVESCRYLVRRPHEIFLAPGEQAPAQADATENLSQEDLLKQPVSIPHRPLKDPRSILMLDPACGSMHFGLYAFDLFERIYAEAWEWEGERGANALERAPMDAPLHDAYPNKDAFLRDVPRLIIERNIHGVDIDPRAAQIAGLSLWLRAQKSWREQGIKPQDRPQIRRSNVVCAEPMPGDKDLLEEFIARELLGNAEDKVVAWMLRKVFEAMTLAGEAGSLLKIEDEITAIITEAKKQWRQGPRLAQSSLFAHESERITQRALDLDASGLTDETFWTRAEERIDAALKDYAAFAEGTGAYRRRLFADDAARGFAFIDLCRKRYDVVLMNPPFGSPPTKAKLYQDAAFPQSKNDLYCAFVERLLGLLQLKGMLGSITSRTAFFLSSMQLWREQVILKLSNVRLFADFGFGVLDGASVETAAFVVQSGNPVDELITFFHLINDSKKSEALFKQINAKQLFLIYPSELRKIPGSPFSYWVSRNVRDLFQEGMSLGKAGVVVAVGLATSDNERFLRTRWEVSPGSVQWRPYPKGGDFAKYHQDIHLLVDWGKQGEALKSQVARLYGSASRFVQNTPLYFKSGLTYPRVSIKGFGVRVLPAGCIFSDVGQGIFSETVNNWLLLGILNSNVAEYFMRTMTPSRKWEAGFLKRLPFPILSNDISNQIRSTAQVLHGLKILPELFDETTSIFAGFQLNSKETLIAWLKDQQDIIIKSTNDLQLMAENLNQTILQAYGLNTEDVRVEQQSTDTPDSRHDLNEEEGSEDLIYSTVSLALLASFLLGLTLGRWDIRYATGEKPTPELPDPFAPLPVCPPGMLQNEQGLPAAPAEVPANYPLRISWTGILVDDEGHPEDIENRVREAIHVIWGERAEAIEQEACQILGVRSLRDYFRKPALFFADHLQRYSKSRRQAPIYWPLSTRSGEYTLWLYYHRLSDQTLYSCVNDFVEPKLAQVAEQAAGLRRKSGRSAKEEKDLERLTDLEQELQDFRAELLRVAAFWKPNLNDGVQITAAPLWKLFQHKPWQKKLKETWEKLEAGEYDWAHLSYSIWPERVREKCRNDKSLAIAHDLEDVYIEPPVAAGKKRGKAKQAVVDDEGEGLFGE